MTRASLVRRVSGVVDSVPKTLRREESHDARQGSRPARRAAQPALAIVTIVAVTAIVGTASAKPAGGQGVLGVSSTLVGNGWREEMICAVKAQALASGKVSR